MKHVVPAQLKSWHPTKPISQGAVAFHDAVINSSWLEDILYQLAKIVKPKIHDEDVVVDFGAGTGTSAIQLLKHIDKNIKLWLVDNSQSWLAKAYNILGKNPNVDFFILEKKEDRYATLAETVGNDAVNHVISANTVHLISNLPEVFEGIALALKKNGTFTFQTGNFIRRNRPQGALMIDDTVKSVHDLAIDFVRSDSKYANYRNRLDERVDVGEHQSKLVFPDPRPVETYLNALKKAGFLHNAPLYVPVKVKYSDWLNFLRVKRLQAGILPEIGGKEPSPKEEKDRDALITIAALKLFKDLELNNPLADKEYFTIDIVYVTAIKK